MLQKRSDVFVDATAQRNLRTRMRACFVQSLPWSQRFSFAAKRERSGEKKTLVVGDVNLTIMLRGVIYA